jgi:hypothetical protein
MSQSNAKGKGVARAAVAAEERLLAFGRKKATRCNAQSGRKVVDAGGVKGVPSEPELMTPTSEGENRQEESTVEKTGKDDSRRRQKPLLMVRTPDNLKGK